MARDELLVNRIAVVTGSSKGLGFATALALSKEGATVVLSGRDEGSLESARDRLRASTGSEVMTVATDLSTPDGTAKLIGSTLERYGRIDILVNNAGYVRSEEFDDDQPELEKLLEQDFRLKTLGYLRTSRLAASSMQKSGWGRIVNVGGIAYRQVGAITSGLRNAGITYLTKRLSNELGHFGITVNGIAPGMMLTESNLKRMSSIADKTRTDLSSLIDAKVAASDIGRQVGVEEVANVIVFLASPLASCITGEMIATTGGSGRSVYY